MRDPYEVLGLSRNATTEQVKNAYRALAKKYHPDNYIGNPLADIANEKMQEINEAYDAIISGKASNGGYSNYSYNDYSQVENALNRNLFDEAERILESMPSSARDARWYYYKGQTNYQRGWTDQAFSYFSMAHKMEPNNQQYRHAYENLNNQRNGGFRTNNRHTGGSSGGCDGCDICTGLLCADCCCECFGGDIIPCC